MCVGLANNIAVDTDPRSAAPTAGYHRPTTSSQDGQHRVGREQRERDAAETGAARRCPAPPSRRPLQRWQPPEPAPVCAHLRPHTSAARATATRPADHSPFAHVRAGSSRPKSKPAAATTPSSAGSGTAPVTGLASSGILTPRWQVHQVDAGCISVRHGRSAARSGAVHARLSRPHALQPR